MKFKNKLLTCKFCIVRFVWCIVDDNAYFNVELCAGITVNTLIQITSRHVKVSRQFSCRFGAAFKVIARLQCCDNDIVTSTLDCRSTMPMVSVDISEHNRLRGENFI